MEKGRTVSVIGLWHLGTVTAACLSSFGHIVTGIDPDKKNISNLKKGIPSIYEPGLAELVGELEKKGTLSFTTDLKTGLINSEYVIIALDTPLNDDGSPNLEPLLQRIRETIPYLKNDCLLVVSSQVPVGTCDRIRSMIKKERPSLTFGICCIPENLQLGNAIARFKSPDILIIGADSEKERAEAERLYWFVESNKVNVNLKTAEMIKHAINAFLAMETSYGNELGNLCDALGVDEIEVVKALRMEPRIGKNARLQAGLGFSGGTIARDVIVLQELGKKNDVRTILLDAIMTVNNNQNHLPTKLVETLFGSVNGVRLGVLGLTYKPGTSTLRHSVPIKIIKELVEKGASVKAYDPKAEYEKSEVDVKFERCKSAILAADSCDALLILTSWPEFRELDFTVLKSKMARPIIIDPTNMLDGKKINELGFSYFGVGRGKSVKTSIKG